MMADTLDELHDMALRISIHRDYFQRDHYDLVGSRRKLAVAAGAVEVSSRMLVLLRRQHVVTLKEVGRMVGIVDVVRMMFIYCVYGMLAYVIIHFIEKAW